MSAPATTTDFLAVVRKSGVLDEDRFAECFRDADELPADPTRCAAALVKAGLLTPFQAKSLLGGKFRGFLLGSYKVLAPIGKGGMGTVFLGEHTGLKRQVALKVLDAAKAGEKLARERFFREARSAAALDHPNIVRLHDVSQGNGVHFLVMEYVNGTDLQSLMGTTGPLHYTQAAHYVAQAAAGLKHAHDKGFVHRDIKPANLILTKDGVVKILDMGLARATDKKEDNLTGQLGGGQVVGTADYLAPEQALGDPASERSDIYSLGATLFALITGHPPFGGTTAQKLMQHQLADPPKLAKLRGMVPPALAEVVCKMMAKEPADRYRTAEDVIDALGPWLPAPSTGNVTHDPLPSGEFRAGGPTTLSRRAEPPPPPQPVEREPRPWGLIATVVGLFLVVAVVGGVFAFGGTKAKPPAGDVFVPPTVNPALGSDPPPAAVLPAAANDKVYQEIPLERYATSTSGRPLFLDRADEVYSFAFGPRVVGGVPFTLADPRGGDQRNVIQLHGDEGPQAVAAPDSVTVAVNVQAAAFHFLGGVGGWAWPWKPASGDFKGKVVMSVRVTYTDGAAEEFDWKNGEQIADWIKQNDVPGSALAFLDNGSRQVRYLSIVPTRPVKVASLTFTKGGEVGQIAPLVFAVTAELRPGAKPSPLPPPPAPAAPPPATVGKYRPVPLAGVLNVSRGDYSFEPGRRFLAGVPFDFADPLGGRKNVIELFSPNITPPQPTTVTIPVNAPAAALHFLGGVSLWGFPINDNKGSPKGTVTIRGAVVYEGGEREEFEWLNGVHYADFIRRHDVPGSEWAFTDRGGHQVRYLVIRPKKADTVKEVVLEKGENCNTAPHVFALTVEGR